MIWLFLIAAVIVIFGFGTLMQIIGTMALIGIGVVVFFIALGVLVAIID